MAENIARTTAGLDLWYDHFLVPIHKLFGMILSIQSAIYEIPRRSAYAGRPISTPVDSIE